MSLGTEQFKNDFLRALAFCSPHKYITIVSHDKTTYDRGEFGFVSNDYYSEGGDHPPQRYIIS